MRRINEEKEFILNRLKLKKIKLNKLVYFINRNKKHGWIFYFTKDKEIFKSSFTLKEIKTVNEKKIIEKGNKIELI